MNESLSTLFQKSNGLPIELGGCLAYPIFKMVIKESKKDFLVRRLHATKSPISGLRIKVVKGEIEIKGERHPEVILWTDTCPESVSLSILSKSGCELKTWNVWRVDDLTQAWVGNAGLLISEENKIIMLECSNGSGEIDFSDLVVQIEPCN